MADGWSEGQKDFFSKTIKMKSSAAAPASARYCLLLPKALHSFAAERKLVMSESMHIFSFH